MRVLGTTAAVLLAAGSLAFVPAVVPAALVAPGGSVTTDVETVFVEPTGEVVATDTRTVVFDYTPSLRDGDSPGPEPMVFDVTFTSQVLRDPVTQPLTFVYRFNESSDDVFLGLEEGDLTLESFAGFETDVSARGAGWTINRSADGATIHGNNPGNGDGQVPDFVVANDATAYDSDGSLSALVRDEFTVLPPDESPDVDRLEALFALTGTFQPIAGDGGGANGGGGTPIPLPAGVWMGLAALFGGGAFAKTRRVLRLV